MRKFKFEEGDLVFLVTGFGVMKSGTAGVVTRVYDAVPELLNYAVRFSLVPPLPIAQIVPDDYLTDDLNDVDILIRNVLFFGSSAGVR